MLDLTFEQAYPERRAVVRKIQSDIARNVHASHHHLLQTLLTNSQTLSTKRRPSAAGTLLEIAHAIGPTEEMRALEVICLASQVTVRRRAYTYLRRATNVSPLPHSVVLAFDTYSDLEAAQLLVRRASEELLLERFDRLKDTLRDENFGLSKLFMRIGNRESRLLKQLEAINKVSYAYVCAKLGIQLSASHMVELYHATMFSDESGLIAWICGQMGLWDALKEIVSLSENPPDNAYRRLATRLPPT